MTPLRKREPLHPLAFRNLHRAARAFHAPQRDHPVKVQHPKPAREA